jgi:hypothetical protein
VGNWRLTAAQQPQALTREALAALRTGRSAGLSRRTLLRRSLGAGVVLWLTEVLTGSLGFLWPNILGGFGGEFVLGTFDEVDAAPAVADTSLRDGAPAYFQAAKTYVQLLDPSRGFSAGESPRGDGHETNVRTLYQRCTHLGCKPNFCTKNTGSNAPATAPATTVWASRSRAWVRPPRPRPVRLYREPGRRAQRQHRQDHAGAIAGRARPAGAHPAQEPHGLHLSTESGRHRRSADHVGST